jgi:hypothetical protein
MFASWWMMAESSRPSLEITSTFLLPGFELEPVDVRVLVDDGRVLPAVVGDHEHLGLGGVLRLGMPLCISGFHAALVREEPDLEHVGGLGPGGIELAVQDTFARAHELNLSRLEHALVSHAVLVLKGALQHVAEDLHIAMRVHGEVAAGGNVVLIDDAQGAEVHVLRVVVLRETEAEARVEPAVVGPAALAGFSKGKFHDVAWFGLVYA